MQGEQSSVEKLEEALKNSFFSLVYLLLKDDRSSTYFPILVTIIQCFQIWSSDQISYALNFFLGLFHLSPYFQNGDPQYYIIFFFMMFSIIFVVGVASIYVSYYFSRTNIPLTTPITVLKIVIYLLTTILFMPLVDFFSSSWNCLSDGYHTLFPSSLQCWTGIHIVLVVCAVLILVVFVPVSGFLTVTFYECRQNSTNLSARITSRSNLMLILFQTIIVLAFSVMSGGQFIYILLVILMGGSLLVFFSFTMSHPYYNERFQLLNCALAAITLWTAIMLCLAKLMEGQVFQGSVIAWMVGVPFIAMIVVTKRDRQIESLIVNVNKFANADELMSQIRYLLQLVSMQATDRHSAIVLDGYIEVHKQTCTKEDCPLRQKKQRNQRVTRALIQAHVEGFSEKYALLLQMVYKMYVAGLKKFANNTELRVSFSFFLLDQMKYKQQSLQEMNVVEQYRPSFDVQFVVFRYKRIIEIELQEQLKDTIYSSMDIIPSSAGPPLIAALAQAIEKCALLHMEFWSQLGEDTPDISKLEEAGTRTITGITDVELKWTKLNKVAPNHLKSLRLYARYVVEILNDEEGGEVLLTNMRQAAKEPNLEDQENVATDQTPAMVVSCDSERFGQIQALNQAAASLFWYNKSELINQKIQMIMPQLYGKHHDGAIENFLNNGDSKMYTKERVVFTKNKAGYIQQTTVTIKQLSSAIQGMSFLGTFFQEKHFKAVVHVLCNAEGIIEGISQSCISLLKLDLKTIKQNINEVLPGVMEDKLMYMNKQGSPYTYNFTKDLVQKKHFQMHNTDYNQDSETSVNLVCTVQELKFSTQQDISGYIIKLERPVEAIIASQLNSSVRSNQLILPKLQAQQQRKTFFFYFQIHSMKVHGEFADQHQYSDIISQRHNETILEMHEQSLIFQESKRENLNNALPQQQFQDIEKKFNYADGFKTVRLFQDRIGEIDDANEEELEQEESDLEQQAQQNQQNQYYDDADEHHNDRVIFKNRKNLNNMFMKQSTPPALRNMKIVSTLLMLSITVLAFVDYFLNVQQLSDIIRNIDVIEQNNYIKAEFQSILASVRDLQLVNRGLFGDDKTTLHNGILFDMRNSLAVIQTNLNLIQLSPLSMSNLSASLYSSNAVIMQQTPTVNVSFDIIQACQQMITKSFNIINTPLALVTHDNLDVYFVEINGYNNFVKVEYKQSAYYFADFIARTADQSSKFLIIVIIVAVILIFSMMVLVPVVISVKITKEEVVKLFLEVPDNIVKTLYTKSENFVSSLQIGEDDDAVSNVDEMYDRQEQEDDAMLSDAKDTAKTGRKKRRKYKSSSTSQWGFFARLAGGAIIMEVYFVFNYFIGKQLFLNFSQMSIEANATSQAESTNSIYNNVERLLFVNPNAIVFQKNVEVEALFFMNYMYTQDSLIHQQHSNNVQIQSALYNNAFIDIMMQNPCPIFTKLNLQECETFADGSVSQGIAVALTRYYENIRYLLTLYMKIQGQPNITFSELVPTANITYRKVTGNMTIDNQLNLMNLKESNETKILIHVYFKAGFRYLMSRFRDSISSQQVDFITTRTALFVVFDLFLLVVQVLFWWPLINRLTSQIWKTRTQLVMIPVSCIIRMKNIKGYIRMVINDNAHHD